MENTPKENNVSVSADRLVKSIVTQFNLVTTRPDQVKKRLLKITPIV